MTASANTARRTRQGNRAGRSAVIEYRCAPLSSEFGMRMLREKFPDLADEILARLGTVSRGPRLGQQRGTIMWEKVVEGGFDYRSEERRVVHPGTQKWDVGLSGGNSIVAAIHADRLRAENTGRRVWEAIAPKCVLLVERATRQHRAAIDAIRDDDSEGFRYWIAKALASIREARATGATP